MSRTGRGFSGGNTPFEAVDNGLGAGLRVQCVGYLIPLYRVPFRDTVAVLLAGGTANGSKPGVDYTQRVQVGFIERGGTQVRKHLAGFGERSSLLGRGQFIYLLKLPVCLFECPLPPVSSGDGLVLAVPVMWPTIESAGASTAGALLVILPNSEPMVSRLMYPATPTKSNPMATTQP